MKSRRLRQVDSPRPDDYMDIWRRGFDVGVAHAGIMSDARQERVAHIADQLRRAWSYNQEDDCIVVGYDDHGREIWGSVEQVAIRLASRGMSLTTANDLKRQP